MGFIEMINTEGKPFIIHGSELYKGRYLTLKDLTNCYPNPQVGDQAFVGYSLFMFDPDYKKWRWLK